MIFTKACHYADCANSIKLNALCCAIPIRPLLHPPTNLAAQIHLMLLNFPTFPLQRQRRLRNANSIRSERVIGQIRSHPRFLSPFVIIQVRFGLTLL